ncbi:MAG: hypothetical protein ACE15D_05315 [Candidatus Eisenbacteria bacterium]|nr:hypothetical protein [Candidatus Eisenbacteria bacterium]
MSRCTQILISLRNPDPIALTALGSLRRYLGFEERLLDLRRRILWEVHTPEGEDPAPWIESMRIAGELWNPNKEVAAIRRPGDPEGALGDPLPGSSGWTMVLAWDPERDLDRPSRGHARATTAGRGRSERRLARGILWSLRWREGYQEVHLREFTREAVLCRGRGEGLLVHPHLEDHCEILGGESVPWLPDPSPGSSTLTGPSPA